MARARRRDPAAPFGRCEPKLLSRPLEFIHVEHLRHRELCQAAEDLAEAETLDRRLAEAVVDFLRSEMTLHVIDEEEDLFPVLRRRLKPSDEAGRIIGLLSGEHAADEKLSQEIASGLSAAIDAKATALPKPIRNALLAFADRQRRHLSVENAIVLPLASQRLSKRDLDEIARRMAARRGIRLRESST
jgi:hemerythrin-like domain-containing protein